MSWPSLHQYDMPAVHYGLCIVCRLEEITAGVRLRARGAARRAACRRAESLKQRERLEKVFLLW